MWAHLRLYVPGVGKVATGNLKTIRCAWMSRLDAVGCRRAMPSNARLSQVYLKKNPLGRIRGIGIQWLCGHRDPDHIACYLVKAPKDVQMEKTASLTIVGSATYVISMIGIRKESRLGLET